MDAHHSLPRPSMHKLIDKVGRFVRPQRRPRHLCPRDSSSTGHATDYYAANMADKEEDFNSLPLPDRFTHKVSYGRPVRLA